MTCSLRSIETVLDNNTREDYTPLQEGGDCVDKVTIVEYAKHYGLKHINVRHKCERGGFTTAEKIGRDWFIDPDEKPVDKRISSGSYVGSRRKKEAGD